MFTDLFSFCPLAQANSFSFFFFCCVQKETTPDLWSRNNSVAFLGDRNSIASARYHNHKGEKTSPSVISARAYVGFVFTFSLLGVHSGHARLVTGRVWRVEIIWHRSGWAGHLTHPYHFQSPISVQRVSDVTKNHGFFENGEQTSMDKTCTGGNNDSTHICKTQVVFGKKKQKTKACVSKKYENLERHQPNDHTKHS